MTEREPKTDPNKIIQTLRNPRFALASLYGFSLVAATPATAFAQDCKVDLLVVGMTVLDNPQVADRIGLADKEDFVVAPPPDFGEAVVLHEGKELRRANLINRDNYARVLFDDVSATPNAKGRQGLDALRLEVYFAKDKVKTTEGKPVTQAVTIQCGRPGWVHAGRYPTERELEDVTSGRFPIRKVGGVVDRVFNQYFPRFSTGMAPQVDDTSRNLADLRGSLPQIKKDLQSIREKEKEQAKPPAKPAPQPAAPQPAPPAEIPPGGKGEERSLPPQSFVGMPEMHLTDATAALGGLGLFSGLAAGLGYLWHLTHRRGRGRRRW